MAEVTHGMATWPGVLSCISCTYTCTHGVSAGVATFVMAAQPPGLAPVSPYGDLTITDGTRSVTLVDCKVDKLESDKAGKVWQVYILDRRWKWAFKQISGTYNVRDDAGELDPYYRRSALDLAVLCLRAMGEADTAALDGLPTDQFPPVNWVAENPASALEAIAGQYGSRVVYQPNQNRVLVALIGVGADLPAGAMAKQSPSIDFPETPDSILLVGAPIEYEALLPLEPVMIDADGVIRTLNNISYKPDKGWNYTPPGLPWGLKKLKPDPKYEEITQDELDKKIEGLFLESYLKYYRVKLVTIEGPAGGGSPDAGAGGVEDGNLTIPRYGIVKNRRELILSDHRASTIVNWDGVLIQAPAEVRGRFVRWKQKKLAAQDAFANSLWTEKTDTPFSVDAAQGLVKFADPMQIVRPVLGEKNDRCLTYPAELVLRCAVQIRAPRSGDVVRYIRELDMGLRNGTGPEVVKRPEVALKIIGKYMPKAPQEGPYWTLVQSDDNTATVIPLANLFLLRAAQRYQPAPSENRDYPLVAVVDPDGAIQQVTWRVGGGSPPLTSVSRNAEHAYWMPSYEELRRVRLLREAVQPLNSGASMKGSRDLGGGLDGARMKAKTAEELGF
jgi:hypothetical protein